MFLAQQGIEPSRKPIVVFQPGAAFPSKRWPADSFITLGKLLAGEGWHVVVSGAPQERELAESIAHSIAESCISIAGVVTFRQTLSILAHSKVCVTGDTALMHAAAGLGVQAIALFGPTSPVETGPYGAGHYVLAGRCTERPCFRQRCDSRGCMRSISPEIVH